MKGYRLWAQKKKYKCHTRCTSNPVGELNGWQYIVEAQNEKEKGNVTILSSAHRRCDPEDTVMTYSITASDTRK